MRAIPWRTDVAGEVAVAIVDVPEEVEVDDEKRQGRRGSLRPLELLDEERREVPGVVQIGLRVHPRLDLELRQRECAVQEHEGRETEDDEERGVVPQDRDGGADQREDDVHDEALRGEQPALGE